GRGSPPPGGYRSIRKMSPGPPPRGTPTYATCGPPSGEKAGDRSSRPSFGVISTRPDPLASTNQIDDLWPAALRPANALTPALPRGRRRRAGGGGGGGAPPPRPAVIAVARATLRCRALDRNMVMGDARGGVLDASLVVVSAGRRPHLDRPFGPFRMAGHPFGL